MQTGRETENRESKRLNRLLLFPMIVVVCFLGVLAWLYVNKSKPSADQLKAWPVGAFLDGPKARYISVQRLIKTGQIVVKSGGYVQYRIRIEPEMRDAWITCSFNVAGGSGNKIEAVVADENEFLNWLNGHPARGCYVATGKKTTGHFEVRLTPGTYILAFSNKFSLLSDKYVFLGVYLNYSRLETYWTPPEALTTRLQLPKDQVPNLL